MYQRIYNAVAMGQEDDLSLWRRFRAGNEKALDEIFDRNVRPLYDYGYRLSRDYALVQDCLQDLFASLWANRKTLGDTDNIRFYLMKSLRRLILRKLKTKIHHVSHEEVSGTSDFEVEFSHEFRLINEEISRENKEKLSAALQLISKRQREVIYHRYFQDLSHEEIADVMSITISSVYNLMSKAMEALAASLRCTTSGKGRIEV